MKKNTFVQLTFLVGFVVLLSLPMKSFSQQWGLYTLYAKKNGTKAYCSYCKLPSTIMNGLFLQIKDLPIQRI